MGAERRPHAKRAGAFGAFETSEDVSRYTKASLFRPGATTDLLIRFSTVAGEMGSPDTWRDVRAYNLHAEDDDFTQPGNLVRDVFDDAQRDRLVDQVSGSLLGGVRSPVLERAFEYWKSVDPDVGKRIEEKVLHGSAPEPVPGMGES